MNSLLPPNASVLERATEGAINDSIESIPVPVRDLWNPERCPAALLSWLAWALSVDNWNSDWPENIKRTVIAQPIEVHRRKGTIGALRRALSALGHGVSVSEWHQYGGRLYHFRLNIELKDRGLSEAEQSEILLTAKQAKNVRSWLEALIIYLTGYGNLHYAIAILSGDICTVYPYTVTQLDQHTSIPVFAIGVYGVETTTLYPQ